MTTDPIVAEIKDKTDIVALISNYVTLKKAGATYKAICPFHEERTPSFTVSAERQTYKCFGCNESGDALAFVMKMENIDFPNALELLANKVGVMLPERTPLRKSGTTTGVSGESREITKSDLLAVNRTAAQFFNAVLERHPLGKSALEYLTGRNLKPETIKEFLIGFAPDKNEALITVLKRQGVNSTVSEMAGRPERFNNRIMFPFFDVIGNIVGFSGRAMGDAMPKYLNTSDTDLFHKNRYIYGLYQAKQAIRDQNNIILVEGQMDLTLAHQAGTKQTVATSGTALSEEHLRILRRYSDTLLLAYDGDGAGQKATERAINMALKFGFEVKVIVLPDGKDPGNVIANEPKDWLATVNKPVNPIDWLVNYYFPETKDQFSATERTKIFNAIFPHINVQPDGVAQSYSLQRLSTLLKLRSDEPVREEFKKWQKSAGNDRQIATERQEGGQTKTASTPKRLEPEPKLIGLIYLRPAVLAELEQILSPEMLTNKTLADLYKIAKKWYAKHQSGVANSRELLVDVKSELDQSTQTALEQLLDNLEPQIAEMTDEEIVNEAKAIVSQFKQRDRDGLMQSFAEQIAKAEADHDRVKVKELMAQMQASLK